AGRRWRAAGVLAGPRHLQRPARLRQRVPRARAVPARAGGAVVQALSCVPPAGAEAAVPVGDLGAGPGRRPLRRHHAGRRGGAACAPARLPAAVLHRRLRPPAGAFAGVAGAVAVRRRRGERVRALRPRGTQEHGRGSAHRRARAAARGTGGAPARRRRDAGRPLATQRRPALPAPRCLALGPAHGTAMDFQIDYGAFRPAPGDGGPLYACVDGRVSTLSNDEVVFYDPAHDQANVMTAQVLQALDQCRPFRSMEEHVARVLEVQPQLRGQEQAVRRVLEGLAGRGLLQEGRAFLERFAAVEPVPQADFAGFHLRACNRPAQLRTLLDGLLARERAHGGGHAVTVVDDSTERAAAREHAELLRQFGEAAGVPVRYVGEEQWQAAIARLQAEAPANAAIIGRLLGRASGFTG